MPRRLEYALARVRIADPTKATAGVVVDGEECLLCPPFYERHIFIEEEKTIRDELRWLTFRPSSFGRVRPEKIGPVDYEMDVTLPGGSRRSVSISVPSPQYTGIFVGPPINGYIPAPALCYPSSLSDDYVVSMDGLRPDVYPYAVPRLKTVYSPDGKYINIETDYILTEVGLPSTFGTTDGFRFIGSSSLLLAAGAQVIPKTVLLRTYRQGRITERRISFPRQFVSLSEVRRSGSGVLDRLRQVLAQIPVGQHYEIEYEQLGVYSLLDEERNRQFTAKVTDGDFLGVYVDFWTGGRGWDVSPSVGLSSRLGDFTFGFGIFPDTPINLDVAALSATSMIRLFWGGYYILEFLPQQPPVFYFLVDGYTVPSSPLIPTKTLSYLNEDFKREKLLAGTYRLHFNLKNFPPIANGSVEYPFVYRAYVRDMSIGWGTKQIQPASNYDFYVIMHLRDHVCIFRYRDILRALSTGERVNPLFAFNPVEYIIRNFGIRKARQWLSRNRNYIAHPESPPRMWWFNVSGFVVIPYLSYYDTAIATKPSFFIPSNQTISNRLAQAAAMNEIVRVEKVDCGGIDLPIGSGRELLLTKTPPLVHPSWDGESVLTQQESMPLSSISGSVWEGITRKPLSSVPLVVSTLEAGRSAPLVGINPIEKSFIRVRPFVVPSPYYPVTLEIRKLNNELKNFITHGTSLSLDADFITVIMRTPLGTTGEMKYGEVSGFVPYRELSTFMPSIPSPDGSPYVDYEPLRQEPLKVKLIPSPLQYRPPLLIGVDIYRSALVGSSLLQPSEITAVFPAPRNSFMDTAVESVTVNLSEGLGNNSAIVKLCLDESAFGNTLPVENLLDMGVPTTPMTTISTPAGPVALPAGQPRPHPLLFRRIVIELGYVVSDDYKRVEGYLYPVFDGVITSVSVAGRRDTQSGRQIELVIKASDIFSRLKWVSAIGKEPVLDNWTPASLAYWAVSAAGLSPFRVYGISGFPLGARLAWWLGSEQIIREQIIGSYGYPILNVPESPRARIPGGSTLADSLERFAAESGCEILTLPHFALAGMLAIHRNFIPLMWHNLLTPAELDFYLSFAHRFVSGGEAILSEIYRTSPWRSYLLIVPAGYYSPVPSWVFQLGPLEYATNVDAARQFSTYPRFHGGMGVVVIPDAPYMYGVIEVDAESSIWTLPTLVSVEGATLWNIPFYYIWGDLDREFNPSSPYYTGFRLPKYLASYNIVTTQQAKVSAVRTFFGGRLFPPVTARVVLGGGMPFIYPRMSVVLQSSDRKPLTWWVVKSTTFVWEAGSTPRTVIELMLPHHFPLGVPR